MLIGTGCSSSNKTCIFSTMLRAWNHFLLTTYLFFNPVCLIPVPILHVMHNPLNTVNHLLILWVWHHQVHCSSCSLLFLCILQTPQCHLLWNRNFPDVYSHAVGDCGCSMQHVISCFKASHLFLETGGQVKATTVLCLRWKVLPESFDCSCNTTISCG